MRGALPHSVERILAAAITEWKHDVHASIFFLQLSPADSDCCTCKMGPYTSCSGTPLGTGTLHSGLRAIPHARKVPKLRPPPRQSSEGGACGVPRTCHKSLHWGLFGRRPGDFSVVSGEASGPVNGTPAPTCPLRALPPLCNLRKQILPVFEGKKTDFAGFWGKNIVPD